MTFTLVCMFFSTKSDYQLKGSYPFIVVCALHENYPAQFTQTSSNYMFQEGLFCLFVYSWMLCFIIKEKNGNRSKQS